MNQADRDRLVALKKADDKKMTQGQVRRLLARLRKVGDKAVLHGLRGRSSRPIDEEQREKVGDILKQDVYKGFGLTLACEVFSQEARPPGDAPRIPGTLCLGHDRSVEKRQCDRCSSTMVSHPQLPISRSQNRIVNFKSFPRRASAST